MAPTKKIRRALPRLASSRPPERPPRARATTRTRSRRPRVYKVGSEAGTPRSSQDANQPVPSDDGSSGPDTAPPSLRDAQLPPEDAATCTSDAGCWSCLPETPAEFLNQCTASQCSPFVNTQRLPNYDGGLPLELARAIDAVSNLAAAFASRSASSPRGSGRRSGPIRRGPRTTTSRFPPPGRRPPLRRARRRRLRPHRPRRLRLQRRRRRQLGRRRPPRPPRVPGL